MISLKPKFKLSKSNKIILEKILVFLGIVLFLVIPLFLSWLFSSPTDSNWNALKIGVFVDLGAIYFILSLGLVSRLTD